MQTQLVTAYLLRNAPDLTWLRYIVAMLGLLGAASAGIGVWGLTRDKPLVISERYFINMPIALALLLVAIDQGRKLIDPALVGDRLFNGLLLALLALLAGVLIRLNTYLIMGASQTGLRSALHSAFNRLNLPFEESESHILGQTAWRFRLTSLGAEVRGEGALGSYRFRIKPRHSQQTLRDIVQALNDYFDTSTDPRSRAALIITLIAGVALLGMAVVLFGLRWPTG